MSNLCIVTRTNLCSNQSRAYELCEKLTSWVLLVDFNSPQVLTLVWSSLAGDKPFGLLP